ncbi:MAG TPA: hypothetical protein VF483_08000, partial [Gemmatimonadaceae bacterium]
MNVRSLVTIAVLLPAAASGQRRVGARIGGGRAAPPAPVPQQPGAIANDMRYVPRPYSVESYFFVNYVQSTSAIASVAQNYGTLGAGTHLDYRLTPHFSVTGDATSSLFGGPVTSASFELGTRFRPISAAIETRAHPYADVRLGYTYSFDSYLYSSDPTAVNPTFINRVRSGGGIGAVAGVGSDFSLTETLALTTGVWAARTHI